MNPLEAAILFLLRHVASHADGPTAKQAQKHLDAVEQAFVPGTWWSVVYSAPVDLPAPEDPSAEPTPSLPETE
jgi:hypothetical protein